MTDLSGISAFVKGDDGGVLHRYSTFARGLDLMNPANNLLDVTALGRQKEGLPFSMSWVRLRDEYSSYTCRSWSVSRMLAAILR